MACSKESALELFTRARTEGRLAHAHLITGASGSGKTWLARQLAASVLGCEPQALLAHPDAHFVHPESKSRRIVIDQIRGLEAAIHRKPLVGAAKAAIIQDADRLQPQAANAFLKTLEEPPAGSFLILTSSLPEAILETILSRCVETSLLGGDTGPGADGEEIIEALGESLLADPKPTIASAFRLTRAIQSKLADARARVAKEYEALFKQESARYKKMEGSEDWLAERENQIKALAESAALREREGLLAAILHALGGALRLSHGGEAPHPVCARLSERFSTTELLAMIEAWERMQRRLAMNINEPLVLEAGILEIAREGAR